MKLMYKCLKYYQIGTSTTPHKTPRKVGRPPKNTPKKTNKTNSSSSPYAHPSPGNRHNNNQQHFNGPPYMMGVPSNVRPMNPLLPPPSPINDFRNRYAPRLYIKFDTFSKNLFPGKSFPGEIMTK